MYRNLNTMTLGISGRQSELIELALTYSFRGLDLDIASMMKRVRTSGAEQARRFMASADIRGSDFAIPIDWASEETTFRSGLVELKEMAAVAASLNASAALVNVKPASDDIPYHEHFEMHRTRLGMLADILAEHNIKLGLAFLAAPGHWKGKDYPFIHEAEALLTLLKTIARPNVGLALDTWNWYVGGGSLAELTEVPGDQIVSVRLADIQPDADLSKIKDEERYMPGNGGLVHCGAILKHLAESNYCGPVTLYPHSSRFAGMTRDAIVQQAKATLDDLWIAAGLAPGKTTLPANTELGPADTAPADVVPADSE